MKFNGGGHINHAIFWKNLSPNGGGTPSGKVYQPANHLSVMPGLRGNLGAKVLIRLG